MTTQTKNKEEQNNNLFKPPQRDAIKPHQTKGRKLPKREKNYHQIHKAPQSGVEQPQRDKTNTK